MEDKQILEEVTFDRLVTWIRENGGKVGKTSIQFREDGERGVFANSDLKAHVELILVPEKCMLTSEKARKETQQARKLWMKRPKFREPDLIALVVHLLATRDDKQNFFAPYYDTLPKHASNFPATWNEEQLDWLKGSEVVKLVLERKGKLKQDYDVLCEILGDFFKDITFEDFLQVRSLVGSRHILFREAGVTAMVPFTDMINHHYPGQIEHAYNPASRTFKMRTATKVTQGQELGISYGVEPNSHYFVLHGFVIKNNVNLIMKGKDVWEKPVNTIDLLELKFEDSDELRVRRMEVLEKCIIKLAKFKVKRESILFLSTELQEEEDQEFKGVPGERNRRDHKYYSLAMTYDSKKRADPMKEVLNFFRVKSASQNQLDRLMEELGDMDFSRKAAQKPEPSIFIDAHNEAQALEELAKYCADQLEQYPESYKSDLEHMQDKNYKKDHLREMALQAVTDEQEIYNFWRAVAARVPKILRQFGVESGDRLIGALSALPQDSPLEKNIFMVANEIAQNMKEWRKKHK